MSASNPYTNAAKLSTPTSTLATNASASRLAVGYRKMMQLPSTINPDELEGELLEEYFLGMDAFLSNNAIPRNFDEDFKSTKEDDTHCCVTSTLLNYMGQHLNYLRKSVIPNHRDFNKLKENEYPEWYTAFRSDFRSACNRFQLLNTGDELFEGNDNDTYPLYWDIGDGKYGVNPYAQVDLKCIMLKIYKTAAKGNNKLEQGAQFLQSTIYHRLKIL
jgi:hypothetical protein